MRKRSAKTPKFAKAHREYAPREHTAGVLHKLRERAPQRCARNPLQESRKAAGAPDSHAGKRPEMVLQET